MSLGVHLLEEVHTSWYTKLSGELVVCLELGKFKVQEAGPVPPGGGGWSPGKCIPLLGRHRETPTLSGTKPYPLWH